VDDALTLQSLTLTEAVHDEEDPVVCGMTSFTLAMQVRELLTHE
jgi:hypothetical protein